MKRKKGAQKQIVWVVLYGGAGAGAAAFNDTFKNKNKTLSVVSASMAIRLYRTKQANSLTQYQYSESTMGKTGFEKKTRARQLWMTH